MKSLALILQNRRYLGVALVFAGMNVLYGTWAIYIPAISQKLHLHNIHIGLSIFFMALGTLIMMVLAPIVIFKIGSGKTTAIGGLLLIAVFIGPFLAISKIMLYVSMFVVGLTMGFTDIAMNTLVSEIEQKDEVKIMSANHGFFSLGGMLSAGIGSFFLPLVVNPSIHILMVMLVCLLVHIYFMAWYCSFKVEKSSSNGFRFTGTKALIPLAVIGFFVMGAEGAVADWSALYLETILLANGQYLGLGFALFSLTMAVGRFLGDAVSERYNSLRVLFGGCVVASVGFALVLLKNTVAAISGFGVAGIGLSVIVPELFRMAGTIKKENASQGISFVAGSGYFGFLLGPVILGLLAEWQNLRLSFAALFFSLLLAILISKIVVKSK